MGGDLEVEDFSFFPLILQFEDYPVLCVTMYSSKAAVAAVHSLLLYEYRSAMEASSSFFFFLFLFLSPAEMFNFGFQIFGWVGGRERRRETEQLSKKSSRRVCLLVCECV